MDDDESAQARRTIADNMIDKLVDRLAGHTRTQRLALLREAFSEVRHRSFAHSPPVALDASGKPLPPSRGEQVFADVGDVLLGELAAKFNEEATTLDGQSALSHGAGRAASGIGHTLSQGRAAELRVGGVG